MPGRQNAARALQPLIHGLVGPDAPVRFRFWDGSSLGPDDARATVVVRSPLALRRLVTAPGELGLGRAYVAGDIDLEGDLEAVLALGDSRPDLRLGPAEWAHALRALASSGLYMAASARRFGADRIEVHQVLAVRADGGRSALPLRRADILLP